MTLYLSDTVKNNKRQNKPCQHTGLRQFPTTKLGLARHYKPVGIAALSAAALCMKKARTAERRTVS